MSRSLLFFLLACLVLLMSVTAQQKNNYNFGVPGRWGNGKRVRAAYKFSLPGSWGATGGKRGGDWSQSTDSKPDCSSADTAQLNGVYMDLLVRISFFGIRVPLYQIITLITDWLSRQGVLLCTRFIRPTPPYRRSRTIAMHRFRKLFFPFLFFLYFFLPNKFCTQYFCNNFTTIKY